MNPIHPSRRTLLAASPWVVPAVLAVGAAPAVAHSGAGSQTGAGSRDCVAALSIVEAWKATPQLPRGFDTGWYVDGTWSEGAPASNHVSEVSKERYRGLNAEVSNPQRPHLPDHSFLSFGNNPHGTQDVRLEVAWNFWVTGPVRLQLHGMVTFGYGQQLMGRTQRQLVDLYVDGLQQPREAPVARLAAARTDGPDTFFPTTDMLADGGMTQAVYAVIDTDREIAARGYVLHQPVEVGPKGRFHASYGTDEIDDVVAGSVSRMLTVRAVLTLLGHPAGPDAWVNDDVVLYPPVVTVSC